MVAMENIARIRVAIFFCVKVKTFRALKLKLTDQYMKTCDLGI